MLINIAIGVLLIILTGLIHMLLTGVVVVYARRHLSSNFDHKIYKIAISINLIILLSILATLIEAGIWAVTYLKVGALEQFEHALYFSIITYTTLGYGDIILGESWRLMSSFEAANGIIMFGWSTSLVVFVVQNIRLHKKP